MLERDAGVVRRTPQPLVKRMRRELGEGAGFRERGRKQRASQVVTVLNPPGPAGSFPRPVMDARARAKRYEKLDFLGEGQVRSAL